ncbi:MAG: hypothetical protein WCL23_03755 [Candidatus Moraniibacteriota bacterium]
MEKIEVIFPSFTFSWNGKQPLQKVVSSFVAAGEACGWSIEERDSQEEKIWNINDIFRPEHSFNEAEELVTTEMIFDPNKEDYDIGDGLRFMCASKTLDFEGLGPLVGKRLGEVMFEIWLQPFHLRKEYDLCDMYLVWNRDFTTEREFKYLRHIHGKIRLEVESFLRNFKNQLTAIATPNDRSSWS